MLMGIFIFIHDQVDTLKVLNIITNANCHFSNSPAAAHKMYSQCLSHGRATCEIAIKALHSYLLSHGMNRIQIDHPEVFFIVYFLPVV